MGKIKWRENTTEFRKGKMTSWKSEKIIERKYKAGYLIDIYENEGGEESNNDRCKPKIAKIMKKNIDKNGNPEYLVKWRYTKGEDTSPFIQAPPQTWETKQYLLENYKVNNIEALLYTFDIENDVPIPPKKSPKKSPKVSKRDKKQNVDDDSGDACCTCHKQIDGNLRDSFFDCRRCSRTFHLDCYIPRLSKELSRKTVCLMCTSKEKLVQLPNDKSEDLYDGYLGKRDLQVCRRLTLEMYSVWPASKSFQKMKSLDFSRYQRIIKNPIALEVIRRKLNSGTKDKYDSIGSFIKDVRLMIDNCRNFWERDDFGDEYIKCQETGETL